MADGIVTINYEEEIERLTAEHFSLDTYPYDAESLRITLGHHLGELIAYEPRDYNNAKTLRLMDLIDNDLPKALEIISSDANLKYDLSNSIRFEVKNNWGEYFRSNIRPRLAELESLQEVCSEANENNEIVQLSSAKRPMFNGNLRRGLDTFDVVGTPPFDAGNTYTIKANRPCQHITEIIKTNKVGEATTYHIIPKVYALDVLLDNHEVIECVNSFV